MIDSRAKAGARALHVCMAEELQDKYQGGERGVVCEVVRGFGWVCTIVWS